MLGIIFLFFIGYYFYRLAENYNKTRWGFALIGLVCYYGITFISSFVYGFIYSNDNLTNFDINWGSLISVGIGVLSCVFLFHFLDYKWKKEEEKVDDKSIDEIGR